MQWYFNNRNFQQRNNKTFMVINLPIRKKVRYFAALKYCILLFTREILYFLHGFISKPQLVQDLRMLRKTN